MYIIYTLFFCNESKPSLIVNLPVALNFELGVARVRGTKRAAGFLFVIVVCVCALPFVIRAGNFVCNVDERGRSVMKMIREKIRLCRVRGLERERERAETDHVSASPNLFDFVLLASYIN